MLPFSSSLIFPSSTSFKAAMAATGFDGSSLKECMFIHSSAAVCSGIPVALYPYDPAIVQKGNAESGHLVMLHAFINIHSRIFLALHHHSRQQVIFDGFNESHVRVGFDPAGNKQETEY